MKRPDKLSPARIAAFLFAAVTLMLAVALIVQCAAIYMTGTSAQNRTETGVFIQDIYSPAIVAERFAQIRWVFFLWLAALVAVLVCRALCPAEKTALPSLTTERRLELLRLRVEPNPAMLAEQKKRRVMAAACAVCCAACAVMVCLYLFNLENFASRELEGVMGAMLLHTAPWIALAFAALIAYAQLRHNSMQRELEASKGASPRKPEPQEKPQNHLALVGRVALYACGALLLALGIANGGMYDVLVKAINICTECIGLG